MTLVTYSSSRGKNVEHQITLPYIDDLLLLPPLVLSDLTHEESVV